MCHPTRTVPSAFALLTALLAPSFSAAATELRCRVVDADTGQPLPCRVYVESAAGEFLFVDSTDPDGSAVQYDVARSPVSFERHTTVSAHPFIANLEPGTYTLTVERGKEYHTAVTDVVIGEDLVERKVELRRWIDMAERGWYSGDTHVHRSLDELPNVMLAEDLNVALPLSYWVRDAYTPPSQGDKSVDVTGELMAVDDTHVIWPMNTEYELFTINGQRHTQGAVFVLNHKQPLTPAAPPVAPIAVVAREQGAILELDKHSWPWSMMLIPVMDVDLFELSNNHIWRTQFHFKQWTFDQLPAEWNIQTDDDGFTEWGWTDFGFKTYYALLNCGFRMRPTAGTASGVHPVPLGYGRVYVHLPYGFTYDGWMQGLDAGRSFVTTGPMLFVNFNGRGPGITLDSDGSRTVEITGQIENVLPELRIEIVRNGEVVELTDLERSQRDDGSYVARFAEDVEVESSSWIVVRCFESEPGDERIRFAHSSPVHVDIKDRPLHPQAHETGFLIRRMEEELLRNRDILAEDELAEYEQALKVFQDIARDAE